MLKQFLEWDRDTFIYLNGLGTETYDAFWSVVTNISTWTPLFIIFFLLLFLKYTKKEALLMTITTLLLIGFIVLAMQLTKESVERLRPNNELAINSIIRILKYPDGFSFFSGHAATSFGITSLMVLFLRKKFKAIWIFYFWPFLFAYSRIYVGVHYPGDLIVGAITGMLCALLFYSLYKKFITPRIGSAHL